MHPLYIPAPYQDSAEFGRLILRDGSTATVRVATLDDAPAVVALFHRLSPESRQHRFFSLSEPTPEFVRSLCDSSNPRRQLTLVITRTSGKNDAIIAAGSGEFLMPVVLSGRNPFPLDMPPGRAISLAGQLGPEISQAACAYAVAVLAAEQGRERK